MTPTKHTPGPKDLRELVATRKPKNNTAAWIHQNRHLIAAAPEMLSVLENVADGNWVMAEVNAAIQKARGE